MTAIAILILAAVVLYVASVPRPDAPVAPVAVPPAGPRPHARPQTPSLPIINLHVHGNVEVRMLVVDREDASLAIAALSAPAHNLAARALSMGERRPARTSSTALNRYRQATLPPGREGDFS